MLSNVRTVGRKEFVNEFPWNKTYSELNWIGQFVKFNRLYITPIFVPDLGANAKWE